MFTSEPTRDVIIEKKKPAVVPSQSTFTVNTLDNQNGGPQLTCNHQNDDPLNLLIHAATMTEETANSQILPSIREVVPPTKAKTMPWMITQGVLPPPFPVTTNTVVRRSIPITELIHPEPRKIIPFLTPIPAINRINNPQPTNTQQNSASTISISISPITESPTAPIFPCTHTGCTKYFPSRSRLKRHTAVHGGLKPFKCIQEGCERTFSRRDNMMQHYRMHIAKQRISSLKISISRPKPATSSTTPNAATDEETSPAAGNK